MKKLDLVFRFTSSLHTPDPAVTTPAGIPTKTRRQTYVEDGATYSEVVIGANGLRGRLRRSMADMLAYKFADQGYVLSPAAARGFLNSKSTGVPAGDAPITIVNKAINNPFVGLLGGGRYLLSSVTSVGDLNLVSTRNIRNGYVPAFLESLALEDDARITKTMTKTSRDSTIESSRYQGIQTVVPNSEEHLSEWQDKISLNKKNRSEAEEVESDEEAKKQHEAAVAQMTSRLESELKPVVEAEIKNKHSDLSDEERTSLITKKLKADVKKALKAKEQESKKLDIQNMMSIETVVPGAVFHAKVSSKERDWTEHQIGLLLVGLVKLAETHNFGINGSIGFGEYVLSVYDENGNVVISFDEELNRYVYSSSVESYVDLIEEYMESIEPEMINLIEDVYGA